MDGSLDSIVWATRRIKDCLVGGFQEPNDFALPQEVQLSWVGVEEGGVRVFC